MLKNEFHGDNKVIQNITNINITYNLNVPETKQPEKIGFFKKYSSTIIAWIKVIVSFFVSVVLPFNSS